MESVGGFGAQGRSPGEGVFSEAFGDGIGRLIDSLVSLVRLGIKEPGLGGGLGELGEGDADEPDGAEAVGPEVEEGLGSVVDGVGFVGLVFECDRAGDGLEVAEADFDGDGFGVAVVFAQAGCDIAGLSCDDGADFIWIVEIGCEGVLVGDGLCAAVDADGSIVEALGEAVEFFAEVTQAGDEGFDG